MKTVTALAVALITTIALMTITASILMPKGGPGDLPFNLGSAILGISLFTLVSALPCIAVIGPLWFGVFRLFRPRGLRWHLPLGAVIGAASGVIAGELAMLDVGTPTDQLLQMVAFGVVFGVVGAAVFWLIRRPDRDAPANPASTAP